MRTNCDNCGAVLVKGKCEYCGADWGNRVGLSVGEHGYIANISTTLHTISGNSGRNLMGTLLQSEVTKLWSIDINIIGLSTKELKEMLDSLTGTVI